MIIVKVIFIHGNGGCTADMNWYISAEERLQEKGFNTIRETLLDNDIAHEHIWIPHIRDTLGADQNSVLIGHSSGAIAALRYAEQYPITGSVLVSPYHTHLNLKDEKAGGWFDRPWNWQKISENQRWIVQFSSVDDPWIPIEEAQYIHSKLNTEYFEFTDRGHFLQTDIDDFPELVTALLEKKQH
ncbi:RBBP9/YdeN family alpha/beta hydrolase [Endozoicomonas atrinae]|uniref:RBBP9/YdeN family alpha/beta hydrolase n=1 Tax=Endozoicomonas atrinae TaxID=1333660 RepID=UPI003B00350F